MIPLGVLSSRRPAAAGGDWSWADDFNRPDGDLGPDWEWSYNPFRIVGGQVSPTATGANLTYTAFDVPSPDCWAEVDVLVYGNAPTTSVWVRRNPGEGGYSLMTTSTTLTLSARSGGLSDIQIIGTTPVTWSLPARLRIEAEGDQIRGYVNGELLISGTDALFPSAGSAGLSGQRTNGRLDNFATGVL